MDARDTLRDYLKSREIKPGRFARSINYDRGNFHRLLNNPDAKPSLDLAAAIERETGGAVPASAWAQAA